MKNMPVWHGYGHVPAAPYIVHCIEDLVSGAKTDAIPGRLEGEEIIFDRGQLLALLLLDLKEQLNAEPATFAEALATWLCSADGETQYAA